MVYMSPLSCMWLLSDDARLSPCFLFYSILMARAIEGILQSPQKERAIVNVAICQ